jgi:hypothetical protein
MRMSSLAQDKFFDNLYFLWMNSRKMIRKFYSHGDRLFQFILDRNSIVNPFINKNEALFDVYVNKVLGGTQRVTGRIDLNSAQQVSNYVQLVHANELIQNQKNIRRKNLISWVKVNCNLRFTFQMLDYLLFSITLGIYFLILQGFEYSTVPFHINDTVFGSSFFMLTGLHGLHVMVGILFLSICYIRIFIGLTSWNNLGLHFGAWYWHFVDVVWILLYLIIYLFPFLSRI